MPTALRRGVSWSDNVTWYDSLQERHHVHSAKQRTGRYPLGRTKGRLDELDSDGERGRVPLWTAAGRLWMTLWSMNSAVRARWRVAGSIESRGLTLITIPTTSLTLYYHVPPAYRDHHPGLLASWLSRLALL